MKIEAREYTQLEKLHDNVSFFSWLILSAVSINHWVCLLFWFGAGCYAVNGLSREIKHAKWKQQNEKP